MGMEPQINCMKTLKAFLLKIWARNRNRTIAGLTELFYGGHQCLHHLGQEQKFSASA